MTLWSSLLLKQTAARRCSMQRFFSSNSPLQQHDTFDVLIVGGGVVGSALARQLTSTMPNLSVGLLERGKAPPPWNTTTTNTPPPQARCYALSPKSLKILGDSTLARLEPAYYDSMQVWEQDSPSLVMFDCNDLQDTEFSNCGYLGAIMEDAPLVSALWEELRCSSSVTLLSQTQLVNLETDEDTAMVHVTTKSDNDISTLTTRLLVAADGANSQIRTKCGIPWQGVDYHRTALTCTVQLSPQHVVMTPRRRRRAYQRFLPHGPLALLPTKLPTHATIVWSTTPEQALHYKNHASQQEFVTHMNSILQQGPQRIPPLLDSFHKTSLLFGNLLNGIERVVDTVQYGLTMAHWNDHDPVFVAPPVIQNVAGPLYTFPLSCKHATTYVAEKNRIALVGDAAHTVHPMAGQGLNFGLDDVGALTKCLERSYKSGMDMTTFLHEDYNSTQRLWNTVKLNGIHALHEMFGNHSSPIMQHGKSLGMHAVNHVGPIRRQLAAVAAGAI